MPSYVATFHTHLAAMRSARSLEASGGAENVAMSPVPRCLSSSCGTCVRYSCSGPAVERMDSDLECVYQSLGDDNYRLVHRSAEQ